MNKFKIMAIVMAILMCASVAYAEPEVIVTAQDIIKLAPLYDTLAYYNLEQAMLTYDSNSKILASNQDLLFIRKTQLDELTALYKKGEATKKQIDQAKENVRAINSAILRNKSEMSKAQNVARKYSNVDFAKCDLSSAYFVINTDLIIQELMQQYAIANAQVTAALEKQEKDRMEKEQKVEVQKQVDASFEAMEIVKPDNNAKETKEVAKILVVLQDDDGTLTSQRAKVNTDGIEVDEGEIAKDVKNCILDITMTYQDTLDVSHRYNLAYAEEIEMAQNYKKGLCSKNEYYDTQIKLYKLRGDVYQALSDLSNQMYALNKLTGGWLCKDFEKFKDIY